MPETASNLSEWHANSYGDATDRIIPPDARRVMSRQANATVVETAASHAVYVSQRKR